MPCRFASSGTVASSRSASRAILALNVASNFLRDLVIAVLHGLRHSRTLHTLTSGPIYGGHFSLRIKDVQVQPNHGSRHCCKTTTRVCGREWIKLEFIQGHAPRTEGEKYGE